MQRSRLQDEGHLNWLRDGLALFHIKKGLELFTTNKAKDFHDFLHTQVIKPFSKHGPQANHTCTGSLQMSQGLISCKKCTSKQIQRNRDSWKVRCCTKMHCGCPIPPCCDSWLQTILKFHTDPQSMIAKNFDLSLLPLEPFEVAKVFMSFGSSGYRSAEDADPFSLLKFLKNCQYLVYTYMKKESAVEETILIRCRLMHSNSMGVDDAQLDQDLKKMVEMLEDLKDLTQDETNDVQEAISKIKEVKTKTFGWAQEDEFQAITALMKDLDTEVSARLNTQDTDLKEMQIQQTLTGKQFTELNTTLQQTKQELNGLKTFIEWFWRMVGIEQLDGMKIREISTIFYGLQDKLEEHRYLIQTVKEHAKVLQRHEHKISNIEDQLSYQNGRFERMEGELLSSLDLQSLTIENVDEKVTRHQNSLDSLEPQVESYGCSIRRHDSLLDDMGQKQSEHEQKLVDHDALLGQISSASSQPQELMPTGIDMVAERQASKEMYRLQADIAKYLEIAFLAASDYPDLSREIRLTSNEARTLHQSTLGLMKRFYGSADNIVDMLIPMIRAAVEVQDPEIVQDVYVLIIEDSKAMKAQGENTKERCEFVNRKINENINLVNMAKHRENQNSAAVEEALRKMQERQIHLNEQVKEIQREKERHEEHLISCKEEIDKSIKQQATLKAKVKNFQIAAVVLGTLAVPTTLLFVTTMGPAVIGSGATFAIHGLIHNHQLKKKQEEYNILSGRKDECREKLSGAKKSQRETASKLSETARKIAALTKKEQAIISNITSLQDAYASLLQIDLQLVRMTQFWDDICTVISMVHGKTKASQLFSKEIRDPAYTKQFLKFVDKAEQSWIQFKGICKDYVGVCSGSSDFAVDQLYSFLYFPVDNMTRYERKSRQNALIDEINNKTQAVKFY